MVTIRCMDLKAGATLCHLPMTAENQITLFPEKGYQNNRKIPINLDPGDTVRNS